MLCKMLVIYFLILSVMENKADITFIDKERQERKFKKHSSLVAMSNLDTLMERKVMDVLICIALDQLKHNPDRRMFVTDVGQIRFLSDIKDNGNVQLKKVLRGFASKLYEYNVLNKDKKIRGVLNFLAEAKIVVQ